MAEGGRSQQTVYNIHIHNVQEGDNVERTETNIIDSTIEQVNVQQQDGNNGAAENPLNEEHEEIIQAVDEMNLSSSTPATSSTRKKKSTSSDQGRFPQKELPDVGKSGRRSFRCELVEEEFASLCARSEFEKAVTCIEQMTSEQRKYVGLNTLLRMAECYAELGRDRKAEKTIKTATGLFTTSSDVNDVIKHAGDLIADKSYFRALVLLRILSDMYALNSSLTPNDIVRGIYECARKMHLDVIKPMIESGGRLTVFALKYGRTFMSEMTDTLRAVENADPKLISEYEAYCVLRIGYNYLLAKEFEKCIEFCNTGVDVMKRQFDKNASKYQIYGHLLHNLGAANYNLGRYSVAVEYYTKAIDSYNNASDFINEDEKQKFIESTQKNLKIVRAKIK